MSVIQCRFKGQLTALHLRCKGSVSQIIDEQWFYNPIALSLAKLRFAAERKRSPSFDSHYRSKSVIPSLFAQKLASILFFPFLEPLRDEVVIQCRLKGKLTTFTKGQSPRLSINNDYTLRLRRAAEHSDGHPLTVNIAESLWIRVYLRKTGHYTILPIFTTGRSLAAIERTKAYTIYCAKS